MISTNVQRAAGYLDYFHPGWFYQVNPATLDMRSCRQCVLGQLHGVTHNEQWSIAMEAIFGVTNIFIVSHQQFDATTSPVGFSRDVFLNHDYRHDWVAAIQQRLAWALPANHPDEYAYVTVGVCHD